MIVSVYMNWCQGQWPSVQYHTSIMYRRGMLYCVILLYICRVSTRSAYAPLSFNALQQWGLKKKFCRAWKTLFWGRPRLRKVDNPPVGLGSNEDSGQRKNWENSKWSLKNNLSKYLGWNMSEWIYKCLKVIYTNWDLILCDIDWWCQSLSEINRSKLSIKLLGAGVKMAYPQVNTLFFWYHFTWMNIIQRKFLVWAIFGQLPGILLTGTHFGLKMRPKSSKSNLCPLKRS